MKDRYKNLDLDTFVLLDRTKEVFALFKVDPEKYIPVCPMCGSVVSMQITRKKGISVNCADCKYTMFLNGRIGISRYFKSYIKER